MIRGHSWYLVGRDTDARHCAVQGTVQFHSAVIITSGYGVKLGKLSTLLTYMTFEGSPKTEILWHGYVTHQFVQEYHSCKLRKTCVLICSKLIKGCSSFFALTVLAQRTKGS